MSLSPRAYNLPHDNWRPGQFEAINFTARSQRDVVILAAETGSGKSAIGAALGSRGRDVRVLTVTKALQQQYGKYPDFEVLFGLNAYQCELTPMFSADSCVHADKMTACPVKDSCQYLLRRAATKGSMRQSLSYQYMLAAVWPQRNPTEFLYCDEAHQLPSLLMDYMTLHLQAHKLSRLDLPAPPSKLPPVSMLSYGLVFNWLDDLLDVAEREMEKLSDSDYLPDGLRKKKLALHHIVRRVKPVFIGMEMAGSEAFLIESPSPGEVKIAPLTSAPFFKFLFASQGKKVLASATIGRPSTFAGLLGLNKSDYDFHQVEPAFAPESRPVFYDRNGPKIKFSSPDRAYKKQAETVKRIFAQFPPDAHGLLHFSSKDAARDMGDLLTHSLGDRLWMPPETGSTEQKLAAWETRKKKHPGTVALAYSFHAGVDAPDVTVNLTMKVPFLPLDKYGSALLDYNPVYYNWIAATQVEQAAGRNRRGEAEHYEVPGQPMRKFVGVLDNNFLRLKSNFSRTFNLSLKQM